MTCVSNITLVQTLKQALIKQLPTASRAHDSQVVLRLDRNVCVSLCALNCARLCAGVHAHGACEHLHTCKSTYTLSGHGAKQKR